MSGSLFSHRIFPPFVLLHGVEPNSSKQTEEEKAFLLLKEQRRKTIRWRKKVKQQKEEREEKVRRVKREVCRPLAKVLKIAWGLGSYSLSLRRGCVLTQSKSTRRVLCKERAYRKSRLRRHFHFRNSVCVFANENSSMHTLGTRRQASDLKLAPNGLGVDFN